MVVCLVFSFAILLALALLFEAEALKTAWGASIRFFVHLFTFAWEAGKKAAVKVSRFANEAKDLIASVKEVEFIGQMIIGGGIANALAFSRSWYDIMTSIIAVVVGYILRIWNKRRRG
jgi:hypothetical protein